MASAQTPRNDAPPAIIIEQISEDDVSVMIYSNSNSTAQQSAAASVDTTAAPLKPEKGDQPDAAVIAGVPLPPPPPRQRAEGLPLDTDDQLSPEVKLSELQDDLMWYCTIDMLASFFGLWVGYPLSSTVLLVLFIGIPFIGMEGAKRFNQFLIIAYAAANTARLTVYISKILCFFASHWWANMPWLSVIFGEATCNRLLSRFILEEPRAFEMLWVMQFGQIIVLVLATSSAYNLVRFMRKMEKTQLELAVQIVTHPQDVVELNWL